MRSSLPRHSRNARNSLNPTNMIFDCFHCHPEQTVLPNVKLNIRPPTISRQTDCRKCDQDKKNLKVPRRTVPKSSGRIAEKAGNKSSNWLDEKCQNYTLEGIVQSEAYQQLQHKYKSMHKQHAFLIEEYKKQIQSLTQNARCHATQMASLGQKKQDFVNQVHQLSQELNSIQCENYELKCEFLERRGLINFGMVESLVELEDSLEYEDLLEMQERIGTVGVGLTDDQLRSIPTRQLQATVEDMCSICCDQMNISDTVIDLPCRHLHHLECLEKWAKIKKFCPVCRQKISLL